MSALKERLKVRIDAMRAEVKEVIRDHGDHVISDVTVSQAYGGMRGVKSLVTETSALDPQEGIRFRGHTIPETFKALPKVPGSEMPYVEAHLWLLLTGEFPTEAEIKELAADFQTRARVPQYVFDVLRTMPRDSHPMTMFSAVSEAS